MATVTPNFNWPVPTSTDLVKDGATAIEALGDSIDASLVDLKGGTTGQVLSKASNTDMDFTWVTDAAGDIQGVTVTSPLTGGGTSGTVTVGILSGTTSNLGAVQLSDSTSSTSTTLAATANAVKTTYDLASSAYTSAFTNNYYAGKNKIINGDFNINQRAFTTGTTNAAYVFDRFRMFNGDGTVTGTVQTFTLGAAPVSGYEAKNYFSLQSTGQTTSTANSRLAQDIESVRTLAGQTATVSFWAKAASGTPKIAVELAQEFGSGGSSAVNTYGGQATLSTSWARYSVSVAVPSISGKTIGTNDYLRLALWASAGSAFDSRTGTLGIQTNTIDFWGVQVEAGSTATPFQTATGTIQGELAACQRYYYRVGGDNAFQWFGNGFADSTTNTKIVINNPVSMRIAPSSMDFGGSLTVNDGVTGTNVTTPVLFIPSKSLQQLNVPVASGLTQYRPYAFLANNSTAAFVAFNAEL